MRFGIALLGLCALLFQAGCGSSSGTVRESKGGPVQLKGAGATFPYLAYTKWIQEFKKQEPSASIEYRQGGSAAGIQELQAGTVDFAGSDMPLTDEQIAKFKAPPIHFPTLLGAVVPVYNITGVSGDLKFTAAALAGIFSGKIKRWNDPALLKANAGANLPASPIAVVYRTEGSGTTYAFTDYLSSANDAWKKAFGKAAQVKFPGGTGVSGNDGVAQKVKETPNSIGYLELDYAVKAGLNHGAVQNAAGNFEKAGLETIGAAADAASKMGDDFRVSIVNGPGANSYPICTITWLLVPQDMTDADKKAAMRHFLQFATHDGQKIAMAMDYGVLPPDVLTKVQERVDQFR